MKKLTFTLILFFVINLLQAQNPLVKQWDKRFGGSGGDWLYSFQQTTDGGFILGGYSDSGIGGDKSQPNWDTVCFDGCLEDYWIVKTDSTGNKQWDKRFGGSYGDGLFSLKQTSDRGYILGGWSYSGMDGDKTQSTWFGSTDYWIVKIDSLGNKQWDKDLGGGNMDVLTDLQPTTDGGYIIGGYSDSGLSGDKTQNLWGIYYDYWIIKCDSLGNKQWDKSFGGTGYDWLFTVKQSTDGGYILGGRSNSGISGDKTQPTWGGYDYWIVKTDSLGSKQWDKNFGATGAEYLFEVQQASDGGFILGGWSNSDSSGDKTQPLKDTIISVPKGDYWILKTDSLGNKEWDRAFGGSYGETGWYMDRGSTSQTSDGGYLIAGTSNSPISGDKTENNLSQRQTWVIKTDSLGIKQWDKTLHTNAPSYALDINGFAIQTKDGCYAFANTTSAHQGGDKSQFSRGYYDYWIIKFCDSTLTTTVSEINNTQSQIAIYPNPTNTILNLYLTNKADIFITNLIGEIVLQKTAVGKVEMDISFLSAGVYFIKAGNEVRKFVKE